MREKKRSFKNSGTFNGEEVASKYDVDNCIMGKGYNLQDGGENEWKSTSRGRSVCL